MNQEFIQYIILGPSSILSLIAGIVLILKGRRKLDKGMVSLGISYVLMICFFILWDVNFASFIINYTIIYIVYMGANFFTKYTFYEKRKNKFILISTLTTLNYIILIIPKFFILFNLYVDFILSYNGKILDNVFSITWAVIVFGWMSYASLNSYNQIKNKKIQPWVKKRLLIVTYSAFFEMFISVPDLIDILTGRIFHDYVFYIQMIMIATIMILQFLAWIMPKWLKKLFNHGYIIEKEIDEKLSEDEIIKQLTEGEKYK